MQSWFWSKSLDPIVGGFAERGFAPSQSLLIRQRLLLAFGSARDLRLKGSSRGLRTSSIPRLPYVAPHTAKIHTLITPGIGHRAESLVLKARQRRPCGFDSHRPLHISLPGVPLHCPRTRVGLSPSSHSLDGATTVPSHQSVITLCRRSPATALGQTKSREGSRRQYT
jgi:hypothetical protein